MRAAALPPLPWAAAAAMHTPFGPCTWCRSCCRRLKRWTAAAPPSSTTAGRAASATPNAGYGITSGGWGLAQSSAGGTTHTFLFGGACLALTRPSPCHAAHGAVLEGGQVLEKGAANISVVAGTLSPERAQAMSRRGQATIDPAGGQSYAGAACRG